MSDIEDNNGFGDYEEINPEELIEVEDEHIPQTHIKSINVNTPPIFTQYEIARIIGERALQIELGNPIFVQLKIGEADPVLIAKREFDEGVLPLELTRLLPNGSTSRLTLLPS